MKKKRLNRSKGILFFITGLSGAGKTTFARQIKSKIKKRYGETIYLDGDNLRKIFNLKEYDKKQRFNNVLKYLTLAKFLINNRVNVILSVIGLSYNIHKIIRKLDNHIIILIKGDDKLINQKRKLLIKNIVGKDIKEEFPKNPELEIFNKYNKHKKILKIKTIFDKIIKII